MKTYPIFISLVLMMLLACSCSRQLTSLPSSSQLENVALPTTKPILASQGINAPVLVSHESPKELEMHFITSAQKTALTKLVALTKEPGINKILKKGAQTIASVALKQSKDLTLLQNHTADRGYPQINKAGFIFVAAGILGYFLKLILIACIICAAIGLIVLISPLFRKRY